MKKLLFIIGLIFILIGCRVTYVDVYYVERYPIEWEDTLITQSDHWHYHNNDEWICVEIPTDTFCLDIKDTIIVPTYMGTYKRNEYEIKWNLKTINKYGRRKCN